MNPKRRFAVKFTERETFGRFCHALSADEIPFTLAGFQTVVLAEGVLKKLPPSVRPFVADTGAVKIEPVGRGKERSPLPTPEQTQDLLRKFTQQS